MINKVIKCFEFMKNQMKTKSWLSVLGTSILTYFKEINNIQDLRLQATTINLKDNENIKILLKVIFGDNHNKSEKTAKLKQRFYFWTLIGVTRCVNDNQYIFEDNFEITNNNILTFLINNGIRLINSEVDVKLRPIVKVFCGFIVYVSYRIIDQLSFKKIVDNLNEGTKTKIDKILSIQPSRTKPTIENSTFDPFFEYFCNDWTIEDLMYLYDCILENKKWENSRIKILSRSYDDYIFMSKSTDDVINKIIEEWNEIKNKKTIGKCFNAIDWLKSQIRYNFSTKIKNNSEDGDLVFLDGTSNQNKLVLYEVAHVLSVAETKDIFLKAHGKCNDYLREILQICRSDENGLYIPFSYHKLFDNGYIKIDWNQGKFVLNTTDEQEISAVVNIYGFNENNKFRAEKFEDMKVQKRNYDKIIDLINNFKDRN